MIFPTYVGLIPPIIEFFLYSKFFIKNKKLLAQKDGVNVIMKNIKRFDDV